MPVLLADGINSLLSTSEAANVAGVAVCTISNWRSRGLLQPSDADAAGRPLYKLLDVAKAERATREKARRTFPKAS